MMTPAAPAALCPRCGFVLAYLATRAVSTGETDYVLVVTRCGQCGCAYGQVTDAPAAARKRTPAHLDVSR